MKQFFKIVFATMVGFFLTGFLLFVMLMGSLISSIPWGEDKDKVAVKENSILKLNLGNGVVDKASNSPLEFFDWNSMTSNKPMSLKKVLDNIKRAKEDDRIKGIYIPLGSVNMNLANLDEVREALVDFKESEKFMIGYAQTMGQGAYYLGSACDKIYLFPEGDLMFKGLSTEITFYKRALEKLDVEVQVIRGSNNKFKSAVEPFMYDKMSDANREQISTFLHSIWGEWTKNISESRGLTVEEINVIADSVSSYSPKKALELGMIDGLKYGDQVIEELMDLVSVEDEDDLNMVTLSEYIKAPKSDQEKEKEDSKSWKIKDKVAVIYAAGEIVSGSSSQGKMGGKTIAQAIKKARKDTTVKAIVLRVNSPGGSALASEVMWREAELARAEKPLVVSMGGLAASGGYYISCNADRIFAGANTITGSIGVFGMIPYVGDMMSNHLGITVDSVQTNANSTAGSLTRRLTPYQYMRIQQGVDTIYDTFIGHVAEGRGMTKEGVDEIGQGRVWTGKDALQRGLVDQLGGLNMAIDYAAEAANLEEGKYRLKSFPEEKDPFEELLKELGANAMAKISIWEMGERFNYMKHLEDVMSREHMQARLPFDIVVE